MRILHAAKAWVATVLEAARSRLVPAAKRRLTRSVDRLGRSTATARDRVAPAMAATRERLAPVLVATRERLAPAVEATRERLSPAVEATRVRLAPVMERLSPAIERVREAASEFGGIAVGNAPDTEVVTDPVRDLRDFFEVQDTGVVEIGELAAVSAPRRSPTRRAITRGADEDEELTPPPSGSWSLSTLDQR